MITPEEELERPFIYSVIWNDNECDDLCLCGGFIESPNGHIAEFGSLSAARIAIEDRIDSIEYSNCTFTILRKPKTEWEIIELRVSPNHIGLGNHS
jgi:hypothetical protein